MNTNVLVMPPSKSDATLSEVKSAGPIVIVGANGSGKSRLGWWIEEQDTANVHRVSAQKSLALPEEVHTWSLEKATETFTYGMTNPNTDWLRQNGKLSGRWGNHPVTHLLNDIEALMVLLHTEEYEKLLEKKARGNGSDTQEDPKPQADGNSSARHLDEPDPSGSAIKATNVEETKLDVITRMWAELFPHRKLVVGAGTINTAPSGAAGELYNAADMSDGERVALYLIGECLCAPSGAKLVIDEPEMHLHKSLMSRLWDLIEEERSDCLFVYLTHDLDFAASRKSATYVCLRDFDGKEWDWFSVPEVKGIPEPILLSILGSRKPILFVEGEHGSLDEQIYELAYPEWFVIPRGSCAKVIEAVRTFRSLANLHRLDVKGIVDKDYRPLKEVEKLARQGIFVLGVANIENIFLAKDVLKEAAGLLKREDCDALIEKVKQFVIKEYKRRRDDLVIAAVRQKAIRHLLYPSLKGGDITALDTAYKEHVSAFDAPHEYALAFELSEKLLSERDYAGILTSFSGKGLPEQVSSLFEMKPEGYRNHVIRMAKADKGAMRIILRQQLPSLG